MSLRVLFLTYHFPLPGEPGAFRPLMEARLMKKAGYDVTVITSGVQYMTGEDIRKGRGWVTEEWFDEIRILRTWAVKKHRSSLFKRAANYISYTALAMAAGLFKTGSVDRVFAGTDPIFMMPMVYALSVIKGAGLVLDERDLFPETAIATGVIKENWLTRLLFSMQQFYRRRARSIMTATPGIRRRLIEYGHPESKVNLLYNADTFIDEELNVDAEAPSLRELTGAKFIAGYAGGLGIVNDVGTLIRAADPLKDEKDVAFVIIGEGEQKGEYEKWAREQGLRNVFLIGAFPRSITRKLIAQMDVCLVALPAGEHFHATLTSKMFDYMAAGKPVLFCGAGDSAEVIAESGCGFTTPSCDSKELADIISRVKNNAALRDSLGQAARDWFLKNIGVESSAAIMKKTLE